VARDLHPKGLFKATIADHAYQTSSRGTATLAVQFETDEGEIRGFFALSDKAAEHTIRKIRAMGYEGDDLGELADGNVLRGNACQIDVEHDDTYDGTMRDKVSWVHPADYVPGMQRDEATAVNVKKFNALLKREPKLAVTPVTGGEADGNVPDDDDIPF